MDLPQEVSAILDTLVAGIRAALGKNLVGVYLRGSLATGDFNPATSDVDFFAVTEHPVSEAEFNRLAALHSRLATLPNKYGNQLEGAYISRADVRRFRPGGRHPTIYRGEALQWSVHGENWLLERWVVREQGVTLLGPDPSTLIDPISADELREAVRRRLTDWAEWAGQPDDPDWLLPLGHKAYVVETMCRALYTLACGELCSKARAVAWALATLPEPWRSTVERSQAWRTAGSAEDNAVVPEVVVEVRRLVHWAASQGANGGSANGAC